MTSTAVRPCSRIVRSYSSQSSWVPPAAVKMSRSRRARMSSELEPGLRIVRAGEFGATLDRGPLPPLPECHRDLRPGPQVGQFDPAVGDETQCRLAGRWVGQRSGVDQRRLDRVVGAQSRHHGQAVVVPGQCEGVLECGHGRRVRSATLGRSAASKCCEWRPRSIRACQADRSRGSRRVTAKWIRQRGAAMTGMGSA